MKRNLHEGQVVVLRNALDELLELCEQQGFVDLNEPKWYDAYRACARTLPLERKELR